MSDTIRPPATLCLIGLGAMGLPMAARLRGAGFTVRGADLSADARAAFAETIGLAFETPADAARKTACVITMLPNSAIVRDVVRGLLAANALQRGALVIDMSSSAPTDTVALAEELASHDVALIDAPVSGGVKRAVDGTLAIMAGGPAQHVERARAVLEAMGKSVFATGPIGSGHAMKALNNYVSAAGLIAACEALLVGRTFGLEPGTIVDVLNASTGKNNSTEVKMKPFVIAETYASGFALGLMAKDLRIASDLAEHLKLDIPQIGAVADIWEKAREALQAGADHTEIYRYLAEGAGKA